MTDTPPPLTTAEVILRAYEENAEDWRRGHLGASEIGGECERQAWLSHRWTFKEAFSGRMLRLFEHGRHEERRVFDNLQAAGITAYAYDPHTGKQFRYSLFGGHFSGSIDGWGIGFPEAPETPHLVEVKTHNEKSFKDLQKHGVRESKPQHFAQVQAYLGMSGLPACIYIAVNKNTDEIYTERILPEIEEYEKVKGKALRILQAENPPPRISDREDFYLCKMCAGKEVCFGKERPLLSCRTCSFITPDIGNGTWFCEKHLRTMLPSEQRVGCSSYLPIPRLLPWPFRGVDSEGTMHFEGGRKVYPGGRIEE